MSSTQPRYPARLTVAFPDEGVRSHETANISAGGMFVRTERELPVGTMLSVALGLPDDQRPTPVQVKVVHAIPPRAHAASLDHGIGLQFIGADDAFGARLERYLQSVAARTAAPVRVLIVARDLLHESGWTQLDARDAEGRYCLSGALAKAAGEDRAAYRGALQSIGARLGEPGCQFGGFDCHCSVMRWNDREGRTKREVVAKLDEVIDRALATAC
jgi:uncharacterized protein (TIGR02266 family)